MPVRVGPGAPAAAEQGARTIERLADDFWTFRGHYRFAGLIDLGTQMSLVRRGEGRFTLLDSYALEGADRDALLALTDGGKAIDTVLNLHPFHTLHCAAVHALVPHAQLIGTHRHREKLPELPWADGRIEDAATQARLSDIFAFSVPLGVDFICADETVHVASVLARHRASGIVHVDDTLNVFAGPALLRAILPEPRLSFHPMLRKALQKRAGAADEYAGWARDLAERWADTPVVCAAHSAIHRLKPGAFRHETLAALDAASATLDKHRQAFD